MTALIDDSTSNERPRFVKKFLFLLIITLVVVVTSAFSLRSETHFTTKSATLKAASVAFLTEANQTPNPGFTVGPKCSMRIVLLIDRSGSIMGNAVPQYSLEIANTIKSTVNSFYGVLKTRADGYPGSQATVMVDAFATYSIPQNGIAPDPSIGLTSWDWLGSLDLADPNTHPTSPYSDYRNKTNLQYQQSVINNIFYNYVKDPSYDTSKPNSAYRGYYGTTGNQVNTSLGTTGTNYDDALISAAHQISFWTGGPSGTNPDKRGDDDFDLVLMVTDGQPTMNDGPNHVADVGPPAEDGLKNSNPEPIDVQYAQNEVNVLRTGRAFTDQNGKEMTGIWGKRPPVNVIGIIAGKEASNPNSLDNMDSVFGSNVGLPADSPKNWYATNGFAGDLADALRKSINDIGCKKPDPAHPKISLTTNPSGAVEVPENQDATVSYTITNTGDTDLTKVKITNTVAGVTTVLYDFGNAVFSTGDPGTTKSYTFSVPLGAASPFTHNLKVTSVASLDGRPLAPGFSDTPFDSKSITFKIKRSPLPS